MPRLSLTQDNVKVVLEPVIGQHSFVNLPLFLELVCQPSVDGKLHHKQLETQKKRQGGIRPQLKSCVTITKLNAQHVHAAPQFHRALASFCLLRTSASFRGSLRFASRLTG